MLSPKPFEIILHKQGDGPPIRTLSMHQRSIIIHIAYPLPLLPPSVRGVAFITLPFLPLFLPFLPQEMRKLEETQETHTHTNTHTHTRNRGMSKGDERRKRKPRGFCVHRCSYAKTTVRLRPFQPSLSPCPSLSLSPFPSVPPTPHPSVTTTRVPTVLKLPAGFFHRG